MIAAIFCYSGDSSDSVIAAFSGNSDGLSHLRPTDSEYTCEHLENSDRLLADAEVGEDVAEEVVGADFAGDFAEVVHGLTDVLRYEVARQVDV